MLNIRISHHGAIPIAIAFGALVLLMLVSKFFGIIAIPASLFVLYFFRDPVRSVPVCENLVVSPADGVITKIEKCIPQLDSDLEESEQEERYCITIFLNVFNVHVNRIPISGEVMSSKYFPGKFLNAAGNLDDYMEAERQEVSIKSTINNIDRVFHIVQIAGLIARRIVCEVREGNKVGTGERFGIIKFGSKVQVYLPGDMFPSVCEGQTMIGGETVLAHVDGTSMREFINI